MSLNLSSAHARDWDEQEVSSWLSTLNLKGPGASEIPQIFQTHEIDGDALFTDIDHEALGELGISFLQRKKIIRALDKLIAGVEERESWTTNTPVQVYSMKRESWCDGTVLKVFEDSEGEWLEIGYGNLSKQVQRYCEDIRPSPQRIEHRIEQRKSKRMQQNGRSSEPIQTSPPPDYVDQINDDQILKFLPDSKPRTLWIDMAGRVQSVPMKTLLSRLCDQFVNITDVTHRPLSRFDCNYLSLLLCTRFGAQENEVSITVFSRFWSQWFYPFCLTICSIRLMWEQKEPKLIHGLISKQEAETQLQNTPSGTFLIRMSDSQPGCFSLMFFDTSSRNPRVRYLLIQPTGSGDFELSAGTNMKKASLSDIVLSLKKLKQLHTSNGLVGKREAFEPFARQHVRRAPSEDRTGSEAGNTMTGTSFISEGSTLTEIPKVVIIQGREGLSGHYSQYPPNEWRGGRPTYKGPVHPQENEHVCLWFDDQRSEWTLSLESMIGSNHCLAFTQDPASDPSKISPFHSWQVALGADMGWGHEKLVIRTKKNEHASMSKPSGPSGKF